MTTPTGDVSIHVNQDLIRSIIEPKIKTALLTSLGGHESILREIVHAGLSRKVDSSGKPSSYSDAMTFLDYLVNNAVAAMVKECLAQMIEEVKPTLCLEMEKQLKRQNKQIAAGLLDGLLQIAKNTGYNSRLTVSLGLTEKKD